MEAASIAWEIISVYVSWVPSGSKLSFRDLAEKMVERRISLTRTTIMHWVQRYVPESKKRWNRFARQADSPGASTKPMRKSESVGPTRTRLSNEIRATPAAVRSNRDLSIDKSA